MVPWNEINQLWFSIWSCLIKKIPEQSSKCLKILNLKFHKSPITLLDLSYVYVLRLLDLRGLVLLLWSRPLLKLTFRNIWKFIDWFNCFNLFVQFSVEYIISNCITYIIYANIFLILCPQYNHFYLIRINYLWYSKKIFIKCIVLLCPLHFYILRDISNF